MADTVSQTVLFPDLFDKPLVATFDQQHASSDGGAVLLKAAERQYGLIDGFAECLVDDRQPGKVRHTLADLLGQRIFGIACGHPDGNDGDRLADDPIHKLLLGRDPITGDALASQPTISRFENDVGSQELYAMGQELAMSVIERQQRRRGHARRVTIDLDPTDDATHGAQQLTFFNKYYDRWNWGPTSSPRCAASSSTCRPPPRTSTRGGTSPSRSAPPRLARTFAPPSRVTGLRETAHGGAVPQAARNGPSAQSFDQRGLHSTAATSDPSVAIRSHRPGNRNRTLYE